MSDEAEHLMFFLSLCPGETGDFTTVLAINQTFKNVQKYYSLIKIISLPCAYNGNEIRAAVESVWRDKDHVTHKRLFSQDRRPSRMVQENPRLMVNYAAAGNRLAHDLRASHIPAEGFFIQKSGAWSRETPGKGLGDNYRVSAIDLMDALGTVYAQNRLNIANATPHTDRLVCRLEQIKASRMQNTAACGDIADALEPADLVFALSIPVWFRENIRYHRPYRA